MFNTRQVGVKVPDGDSRPRDAEGNLVTGPPQTVSHAVVCQMVALQWFDKKGVPHDDVFLQVGGVYYKPAGSEEWAKALGPVLPWMKDAIDEKIGCREAKDNEGVPDTDSVAI